MYEAPSSRPSLALKGFTELPVGTFPGPHVRLGFKAIKASQPAVATTVPERRSRFVAVSVPELRFRGEVGWSAVHRWRDFSV